MTTPPIFCLEKLSSRTLYNCISFMPRRNTVPKTLRDPLCARLRRLISPYDHGLKHRGRVIHAGTNERVVRDLNARGWVRGLTNASMHRHFAGEQTAYFTADGRIRTPEVLLMIDVDCHKAGTHAAAVAFAGHLRDAFFPDLYFEPSTNGNGAHAYLFLDTRGFGDERTHALFGMLDRALKGIHADWQAKNPGLVVELVEVKGHPPRLDRGRDGLITAYTSGQLAKLPREADRRREEFLRTTKVDERRVSDLYRTWKVERAVPRAKAASPRPGSITGHVVARDALDQFDAYLGLAGRLLPGPLRTSGRELATAEDLAILLLILEACTERMNADGSMPTARILRNWQTLLEEGAVRRPFNSKRYAALRDFLSREELLAWEDESYVPTPMSAEGKGRAARWRASGRLMAMIEAAREGIEGKEEARGVVQVLGCGERERGEHLYGDSLVLPLSEDTEGDIPGGISVHRERDLPSRAIEETSPRGDLPPWLRGLTYQIYPRPVLRVPSCCRMAA